MIGILSFKLLSSGYNKKNNKYKAFIIPQRSSLNSSEIKFLKNSLKIGNNKQLTNPEELIQAIEFLNGQHDILNEDRFGQINSSNIDAVILVQVFKIFLILYRYKSGKSS